MEKASKVRAWATAYFLVAVATVSLLPTHLRVSPSVSDSYVFGYNNTAGLLLLLLFVAGAALLFRVADNFFDAPSISPSIPRSTLILFMGIGLLGCVLMYFLTARFHGFGESAYLINRVQQAYDGRTLYKDFEFAYGAALIYPPVWLMHFGLSATNSYYLFWTLNVLIGFPLLYVAINLMDFSSLRKREIFSLLSLFSLPAIVSTGVNYTLFRFAPLLLFSVLIYRAFVRSKKSSALLSASLQVFAFSILLLLISPETAVALAAGSVLYLAIYMRPVTAFKASTLGGLIVALLWLAWFANRLGALDSIKQRGGGYNFPIFPCWHILFFAGALLLIASLLRQRMQIERPNDSSIFVLATALPMIAGALGRCDPTHVGFNGLGILLVALLYASRTSIWRPVRAAFLVCIVFGPNLIGFCYVYRGLLARALFTSLPQADPVLLRVSHAVGKGDVMQSRLESVRVFTASADRLDLSTAYPDATGTFLAPFGYFPNGVGNYHSLRVSTGYFFALSLVFTPVQVQRKINELGEGGLPLLLPADFRKQCELDPKAERHQIEGLFLFPYLATARHTESLLEPLCDSITSNYRMVDPPTPERMNYGVWTRLH